jgi:hypothetical protein
LFVFHCTIQSVPSCRLLVFPWYPYHYCARYLSTGLY